MSTIKVGFIGCGKQGMKHVRSLKKIPGVEVLVADIRQEAAKGLADQLGVSWVHDPQEIFEDASVDAVAVCTPTPSHVGLVTQALDRGKHVFCEKPLSNSTEETAHLSRRLEGSDRIVMTGFIYRFAPVFEEGYRLFREECIDGESAELGRIVSGFFRLGGRGSHEEWKHRKASGGGAIKEMLVHMVDLASWYFGPLGEVELISCGIRIPRRTIQGRVVDVDAEDYVWMRCKGAGDVDLFFEADLITPAFSQYVEVQGENGSFMGSIQEEMSSYVFLKESRNRYQAGRTVLHMGTKDLVHAEMSAFVEAVRTHTAPDRNSFEESLRLMRVMQEIERQAEKYP